MKQLIHSAIPWLAAIAFSAPLDAMGFSESFDATYRSVVEFELDAEFFDVVLEAVPGNSAAVSVRNLPRGIALSERVRDGAVRLNVRGNLPWFGRDVGPTEIRVEVPAGTDVRISTSSGDIAVEGVQGIVELRAASGDIDVVESGGTISARSSAGGVSIDRVVGNLAAETSSGDIRLREVRGLIAVRTSSGRIDAERLELTGNASMETQSGDIDVDLANRTEDLRYELTSSSGDLAFGDQRGSNQLVGGAGRFTVTARTSSGDQRFY